MTTKKEKPMKLEVKKINTKQYESKEEREKKHNKVEDKKKVKIRAKAKTWTKGKAEKKNQRILRDWRKVTIEDEQAKRFFVGKPRIFKSWQELLDLFNCYIASCLETVKKNELVPIRTEEKGDDLIEEINETIQASKNENFKIDNTLVTEYEIVEEKKWKCTPTVSWFLIFLWWISFTTRSNYKHREEYMESIEVIENYLEGVLTQRAIEGEIPANVAQFVLNVNYNRVPKSKSEEVIKTDIIDESELIPN